MVVVGVADIFRQAIKLPAKNVKLMLQVFLLVLSLSSLLVLLHSLIAGPFLQKFEQTYESSSSTSLDPKDLITLIGIEIPFLMMFWVVSLFGISITVYSSSLLICTGKSATLKELMLRILSRWRNPGITWLYVSTLTTIYIVLSLAFLRLTSNPFCLLVGILAVLLYLHLGSVWILCLVISVLEDDCYGLKALGKAQRLIRGRKIQGFFLILVLALLSIPIYVMFYVTIADDDDELGPLIRLAFMFIATVLFCLSNLFGFVVFTVFQFECKLSHGEYSETEKLGPSGCSLVSAIVHPDA